MRIVLLFGLLFMMVAPTDAQLSPKNSAGITFGHVHLSVPDIEVHKKLFVETFGGTLVQKGPLVTIKFPNMLIALAQRPNSGPSQGTDMDHFGFRVRDLGAMEATLKAQGYTIQREFTGAEGFPNAYVLGPDGLRLELQEDTSLPSKAVPNHLHFQTPDYLKLLDWYVETFSLTKRSRGSITTTADAGTMNLSFANSTTPVIGTKGRVIDHIGFEVTDLESFCRALEAKGLKLDVAMRATTPEIGVKVAFLTDPGGTYIELTEGLDKY
jgi:catechol 2,3-dioxygenase-like lactoylglutathione lyase family enzyme